MKHLLVFLIVLAFFSCYQDPEISQPDEKLKKTEPIWNDSLRYNTNSYNILLANPDLSLLPQGLGFKGSFSEAIQWIDKNGKNILIVSTNKKSYFDKQIESDVKTEELFARLYVYPKDSLKPVLWWELNDAQRSCAFDISLKLLSSPIITDLDNNGINEATFIYKMGCRSDVSPLEMKIIVRNNKEKYALRGSMIIQMNHEKVDLSKWEPDLSKSPEAQKQEYTGMWGRFENADSFKNAPPGFYVFARKLWMENAEETFN